MPHHHRLDPPTNRNPTPACSRGSLLAERVCALDARHHAIAGCFTNLHCPPVVALCAVAISVAKITNFRAPRRLETRRQRGSGAITGCSGLAPAGQGHAAGRQQPAAIWPVKKANMNISPRLKLTPPAGAPAGCEPESGGLVQATRARAGSVAGRLKHVGRLPTLAWTNSDFRQHQQRQRHRERQRAPPHLATGLEQLCQSECSRAEVPNSCRGRHAPWRNACQAATHA